MTAETCDQAGARLTLVLDYGNPEPAGESIVVPADEPQTETAPLVGKRQASLGQAQTRAQTEAAFGAPAT